MYLGSITRYRMVVNTSQVGGVSPAPARDRRRVKELTRQEAIDFLNTLPYLVASSGLKLLPEMMAPGAFRFVTPRMKDLISNRGKPVIEMLAFPVTINNRTYTFDAQPFRVIREITKEEYLNVLPRGYVSGNRMYYYEIHTD